MGNDPKKKALQKNQKGFTFIELVLSLVVLGLISLTLATLLRTGIDTFSLIVSRKEALHNARLAVERVTREIIYLEAADILSISPTMIQFNDKNDISTDFHSVASGSLFQVYRGTNLLAENLSNFLFTYYDQAGGEITNFSDIASVRRIKVEMTVQTQNGFGDVKVRGDVYPRNFYYSNFQ